MKPGISRNCETPWHWRVKASPETCLRWPSCGLGRKKKQKETDEQKNPALLKRTTSFQPTSSESQAAGSPAFSYFLSFFFFNYCYDWLHWVFTVVDELSLVGAWGSLVLVHRHSVGGLSSLTRDWTCITCIGRWILNHWTTRKSPPTFFKSFSEEGSPPWAGQATI